MAQKRPLANIKVNGKSFASSSVRFQTSAAVTSGQSESIELSFAGTDVTVAVMVEVLADSLIFKVDSVKGSEVEELTFVQLETSLPQPKLVMAGLALNLQTNVPGFPQSVSSTKASCYPEFGLVGAKFGLVLCPPEKLRSNLKQLVMDSPDLPQSKIGGPWALDGPDNQGSYLFNSGDMTLKNVGDWIACTKSVGFDQIDFQGGSSFRYGDFRLNPSSYPNGAKDLKAVIDRLHANGIKAGLHTYAFFIDKNSRYVSPKPDPRLAKDASFNLSESISPESSKVPVSQDTSKMSTVTGPFERNSATVQIDDELIVYQIVKDGFLNCQRGACGTKATSHQVGAKVHHLKECFGLFVPDPHSSLLAEVAANTAQLYNDCGFDLIYLDALDGEDILGGVSQQWHWGSKFVFELCKRLKRPAVLEMSTFHHHLWYVRSRHGAWDHPTRSYKRFIDLHCQENLVNQRMFLPSNLGWWRVRDWSGALEEPTFEDDIEYLCCKALGSNSGLSLMGLTPETQKTQLNRFSSIFQRYEKLRRGKPLSSGLLAALRQPGREFSLTAQGQFKPTSYAVHKIGAASESSWAVSNPHKAQNLQLRIQALMGIEPYSSDRGLAVAAQAKLVRQAPQVSAKIEPLGGVPFVALPSSIDSSGPSLKLTALSNLPQRSGSWAEFRETLPQPIDLSSKQGLGLWIHGDGHKELINIQLSSAAPNVGYSDHYIEVDFSGWRYCQLVEPEGERQSELGWPYGGPYSRFRENVDYAHVNQVSIWINNLPPNQPVTCLLSPIKALPLTDQSVVQPSLSFANQRISFPASLNSGSFLEYRSPGRFQLFETNGKKTEIKLPGTPAQIPSGESQINFHQQGNGRAKVWIITQGPDQKL